MEVLLSINCMQRTCNSVGRQHSRVASRLASLLSDVYSPSAAKDFQRKMFAKCESAGPLLFNSGKTWEYIDGGRTCSELGSVRQSLQMAFVSMDEWVQPFQTGCRDIVTAAVSLLFHFANLPSLKHWLNPEGDLISNLRCNLISDTTYGSVSDLISSVICNPISDLISNSRDIWSDSWSHFVTQKSLLQHQSN